MTTMNISLPDDMKAWIDLQVQRRSYASSSEFLRDLIRRQRDLDDFHNLIQEGVDSGTSEQPYEEWLAELKSRHSAEQ